ncbi:hypothetical protein Cgig2_032159 [Carnegiea gigantea]|uniref:Uncharacterized protein n=1 Tax=Carnegiea gigantea TaxID=171969 RepID=A0A9Q1JTA5_9CARY|nr:hypothetical protein Cgig2_032159 [Carnegiea gigantea]
MSTDLQFPTPAITDRPFPPYSTPPTRAGILRSNTPPAKSSVGGVSCGVESEEKEWSTTPTAAENKLPVPTSPPPAPKRPRVEFRACKRRLDFFDTAHTKEVDDFFTTRFAEIQSRRLAKKSVFQRRSAAVKILWAEEIQATMMEFYFYGRQQTRSEKPYLHNLATFNGGAEEPDVLRLIARGRRRCRGEEEREDAGRRSILWWSTMPWNWACAVEHALVLRDALINLSCHSFECGSRFTEQAYVTLSCIEPGDMIPTAITEDLARQREEERPCELSSRPRGQGYHVDQASAGSSYKPTSIYHLEGKDSDEVLFHHEDPGDADLDDLDHTAPLYGEGLVEDAIDDEDSAI